MAYKPTDSICALCGKPFIKKSANAKYCSAPCKNKVWKEQSKASFEEYKRKIREEQRRLNFKYKPRETIEEIVAKANAADMSYGKYVALQMEKEGCVLYGREADVHTEDY